MRADDIRTMVLDALDQALTILRRVDAEAVVEGLDARSEEVAQYRETLEAQAEFWRSASPGFVHAWFAATAEEAERSR